MGVTAGRDRSGFRDLAAVEHVLQAIPQRPYVPWIVLHLENDAVVLGRGHRNGCFNFGLAKRRECRLARFQGANHAIQTGKSAMLLALARVAGSLC